jgi:hypothetical protein
MSKTGNCLSKFTKVNQSSSFNLRFVCLAGLTSFIIRFGIDFTLDLLFKGAETVHINTFLRTVFTFARDFCIPSMICHLVC